MCRKKEIRLMCNYGFINVNIKRNEKGVDFFFKTGKMTADKHKFPLIIPNPKRNQNQ